MQGKVSMIMPCYNKVKYIGEMLDSVIAQNWDNIELILVNDGSTDGTREIIEEYAQKIRMRGFELVVIDQENAGVCAAAKAGLERVTGDYVCMVDADDELSPVYVSTMAGWLDSDPECDYCVCGGVEYTGGGDKKAFGHDWSRGLHYGNTHLAERYIFGAFRTTPWIYMLKTEYLRKCNIADTYFTHTKGSHEPAYIIPVLSFGGKFKYLPLPLYHFNFNGEESHSRSIKYDRMKGFHEEYDRLCGIAIARLPDQVADAARKKKLTAASFISNHIRLYRSAMSSEDGKGHDKEILTELLDYVNAFYGFEHPIAFEQVLGAEETLFCRLTDILTGKGCVGHAGRKPAGRVIGYGAMGRIASRLLPELKGTALEPTVLWDKNGDGIEMKKPRFETLSENDVLLIFPRNVIGEIYCDVKGAGCTILETEAIAAFISSLKFPQLLPEKFDC